MRRAASIVIALSFVLTVITISADPDTVDGSVDHATYLGPGTEFTFSYDLQNAEGDVTITGTMSASVTEVDWRGFDSYLFSGTYSETFTTTSGSGSETGTWKKYFRTVDLALMDSSTEGEMTIGTDTVQNSTVESYDPSLRWIEFPLSYENPKSIWSQSDVSHTSTWERTINNDDKTLTSGSDGEVIDLQWVCVNSDSLISKNTDAGTFETYKIREWIQNDEPRNRTTDYYFSEDVGFWVVKDVFVDHEGSQVMVEHYELTEWTSNDPPVVDYQPSLLMEEDVPDASIDLDDVFSDPDRDTLSFNVTGPGPFDIEIDEDNRLVVDPPENASGSWNITVSASDSVNEPVEIPIPITVMPVDDPPELFNPYLDPETGMADDAFTFRIEMTDIDSGSPSSARVHIDSVQHDLSRISGNNESGMILEWSGSLQSGDYSHYFMVDGTRFPSSGRIDGPSVSELPSPYIESGTVDLEEGGLTTDFLFEMTWIGPNGEEPDDTFLVMDGDRIPMEERSGSPASGLNFEISTTLAAGTHSFHFEADLGVMTYKYPASGEIEGPTVHNPEITDHGYIHLEDLASSATYRFYVNYRYAAGNEPSTVRVMIDGEGRDIFEREGDAVNGINYTREVDLSEGSHTFEFRVLADGMELSTEPETMVVDIDIGDDDDDTGGPSPGQPGSEDDGSSLTWFIIILVIAAIIGVLVLFMMKRKPSHADMLADDSKEWDQKNEYQ